MTSDLDLLQQYARSASEEAFAALVRRHLDLVYSAALRQVRSPQLAEEVAQSVFTDLATNIHRLKPDIILAAWLYQVTRRTAIDVVRRESRRQAREQIATEMNATNSDNGASFQPAWNDIEPLLDEAMESLDGADRSAILLRYFENKSLREVGRALGMSDDAAQKRVARAVERLREFFARRRVTVGAGGLGVVISANAVQAAPVGLATAISVSTATAAAGTTFATATVAATHTITMTTLQKSIIGAVLAVAAGTGIYEARQAASLRAQIQTLQQQQAGQIRRLQSERDAAVAGLAALQDQSQRSRSDAAELARLRNEVAGLRSHESERAALSASARNPVEIRAPSETESEAQDLPRDTWADLGFSTPQAALQTRGWAVLNGNRERFRESVFITGGARKTLEDMFVRMAEASNDPNKAAFLQEILKNQFGVEEGLLMPMMAENQSKGYTGFRILSRESPSSDEMILEVETGLTDAPAKKETLKLRRFDNNWKVVIDEDFLRSIH